MIDKSKAKVFINNDIVTICYNGQKFISHVNKYQGMNKNQILNAFIKEVSVKR